MRIALFWLALLAAPLRAQENATPASPEPSGDRFARTWSRSPHAHHIALYDAEERPIDPSAPLARPYSPAKTCGRCHDIATISHGWHFSAANAAENSSPAGRAGEPWIYVDPRTGTSLPLSWRGGAGTFRPEALGFTRHEIAVRFARHLPGGLSAPAQPSAEEAAAWQKSGGALEIDCMSCHDAQNTWSHARWIEQIERANFAWAPSAAIGLAAIDGVASKLESAVDPFGESGVKTSYDARQFSPAQEVFFDVVRTPRAEACYRCHTVRDAESTAPPRWLGAGDVHLRAGMTCADCHGHGLDHENVRGFEGEVHPAGAEIAAFSCRGCHLEAEDLGAPTPADRPRAGRFGAPRPAHAGLPPLHLDQLSCTACHAGPIPADRAGAQQTSLAHALGKELHETSAELAPCIAAPVFARNEQRVIEPQRWTWPAYFGIEIGDAVAPFPPSEIAPKVRRALRVRQDFRSELADPQAFEAKVASALQELSKEPAAAGGRAVYIANGTLHHLSADGARLERIVHPAAGPTRWSLAHDVRPARHSLGAQGCAECHAADAPFFHAVVEARGPAPHADPARRTNAEIQGQDLALLAAWESSFETRDEAKWVAFVSCALVALVLLSHLALGLLRWRRHRGDSSA